MTTSARHRETPPAGRGGPAARGARRRTVIMIAVAALAVILAGVVGFVLVRSAGPGSSGTRPAAAGSTAPRPSAKVSPSTGPARKGHALPALSPAQLAGQRVIYSYSGLTPPASLLGWIRHGEVGGIIFFGPNISSEAQIAAVISELDRANASPGNPLRRYPLLLMTDQEGGEVRRLPGAPLLSEKQIGESAHPAAQAKAAGASAGQNLAAAGLNVNLAPVLDVYRTPGDFDDQYQRSYSTDPRVASRLGADFIKAQQAAGVAATAKHFPGLGAAGTSQNTDELPVTLNVSRHDLRTIDEYPYRAAIAAGVKLVMVSWAIYPALDPTRPAGLSSKIVGGELRQRLGFTGVTITDALEAGALQPFGTTRHRATLAAGAGMDLIMCAAQKPGQGEQARIALEQGYRDGTLGQAAFQASVRRVLALRSGLHA